MDGLEDAAPVGRQPRLLNQVRNVIRRLRYSIRTEQTYVDWIRRFILFHRKRDPKEMGALEVEAFLTYLAVQGKAAASTQNQALNAIVFLYRLRHQDGAGAPRPQGRVDHDELHPCPEPQQGAECATRWTASGSSVFFVTAAPVRASPRRSEPSFRVPNAVLRVPLLCSRAHDP